MHPEHCNGIAHDRVLKKQDRLAYAKLSPVRCALDIQSDGSAFDPEPKLTDTQRMNAFKKDRPQTNRPASVGSDDRI